MSVSAVGQRLGSAPVRHAIATALVFLGLFAYLYGPPLTQRLTRSAHTECNRLTGATYRTYRLEWRTTTYTSVSRPHWVCHDLRDALDTGTDLGWWTWA